MAQNKIHDTFNKRFFDIPSYQRGFAWERSHIRDLYEDIAESIQTGSDHYLGTLVLSEKPGADNHCYIVDGQQRITALMLFINELIKFLPKRDRMFYRRFYIVEDSDRYRLKTLGKDKDYLHNLLKGRIGVPETKSQQRLKEAYEEVKTIVADIPDKSAFFKHIERLQVMEFAQECEGDAIRIFQTVNDRGKPLSNMEKAKSLLIYFSNRYLKKKLDDRVNEIFGEIFEHYDDIKHIGEHEGIDLVSSRDFSEDSIMRQHFVTFGDDDYDATAPHVLDHLKRRLNELRESARSDGRWSDMEEFISGYAESLLSYFSAFKRIMTMVPKNARYYSLFVTLGPSTYLYPVIVKLETLSKLNQTVPGKKYSAHTFLDLIELIDVRVYKTRGTDPRAEISRFAYALDHDWSDEEIRDWLIEYNVKWMSAGMFNIHLREEIYGNRALAYIFTRYCEKLSGQSLTLDELKDQEKLSPTIEHVLSQETKFTPESVGFKDNEEVESYGNRLGNLTVVEKGINSAAQNRAPIDKVMLYEGSRYTMTRALATFVATNKRFTKQDIENRTNELAAYIAGKWWASK